MSVELARMRESWVKGHYVYQTEFLEQLLLVKGNKVIFMESIGIVVKKSGSEQIASHVPDDLTRVLFSLLISRQVLFMKFEAPSFFPTIFKNLHAWPLRKLHDNFQKQGVLSVNHMNDDMVEVDDFDH